ncbi:MAG: hypothetical protein D6814_08865 [Calditrichaeota bacterium]|nr:MAG: hypothetical protein D6814_08865 [Calditrichota bacterium]
MHIGDILARRFEIGFGGDPLVPEIDEFAYEELGLTPESLEDLVSRLKEQIKGSDDLLSLVN